MILLKVWRDGALARIRGEGFAMNPYPTTPKIDYSYDNLRKQRAAWSQGYWWANKNRCIKELH